MDHGRVSTFTMTWPDALVNLVYFHVKEKYLKLDECTERYYSN